MTHFIRDKHNNTVIEVSPISDEDGEPDVRSNINIRNFSERLLGITTEDPNKFIEDMEFLNQIRGYWFERNHYDKKFKTIDDMSEYFCKEIAKRWNLHYVTD